MQAVNFIGWALKWVIVRIWGVGAWVLKVTFGFAFTWLKDLIVSLMLSALRTWLQSSNDAGAGNGGADSGQLRHMWAEGDVGTAGRHLFNFAVRKQLPKYGILAPVVTWAAFRAFTLLANPYWGAGAWLDLVPRPSMPSVFSLPGWMTTSAGPPPSPPPPVEAPHNNIDPDYIIIIPSLAPDVGAMLDRLDPSLKHLLSDLDDLVRQLRIQVGDTKDDIADLLAHVEESPSMPIRPLTQPAAWVWSWVTARNPVSSRAAALSAIAASAGAARGDTASQMERLWDQDFAPLIWQCFTKPGVNITEAQQLKRHAAEIAMEEAKAGLLSKAISMVFGTSPLSRELQVHFEERRTAIIDTARKTRVDSGDMTVFCTTLSVVQESVRQAARGGLGDQRELKKLGAHARSIKADSGRLAWNSATMVTIRRWDKAIVKYGQRYLDGVKETYDGGQ